MFSTTNGDNKKMIATITLGGVKMENTHEFVQKLNEKQKKDEKNRKRQGDGNPGGRLPNKSHHQGE